MAKKLCGKTHYQKSCIIGALAVSWLFSPAFAGDKTSCNGLDEKKFLHALGNWQGQQRKWDLNGNLLQHLDSRFLVSLSKEGQLLISSEYRNVLQPELPPSKNDWLFTCDQTLGAWVAQGFGGTATATLRAVDHVPAVSHEVRVAGTAARSISSWDLSAEDTFVLSTNWYDNSGKLTSTSVNVMRRTHP